MTLLEIIFGGLITQILGLNTRYYFFRIFNNNLKKEDFASDKEEIHGFGQGFYNSFIGLIIFCLLLLGLTYIAYKLNLL